MGDAPKYIFLRQSHFWAVIIKYAGHGVSDLVQWMK